MQTHTIDISGLTGHRQRGLFESEESNLAVVERRMAVVGKDRAVATTPEVEALLANNAVCSVSVSGGKDSVAIALAVARHLDTIGHSGPRLLIHADLGRVEWRDSLPSCERLAKHLGWELLVVRRQAGDMLARWQGRWSNNVARYEALECVKLILPWSTPSLRFCTSEMKSSVLTSALKKRYRQQDILNIVGIRRQESANRSRMPVACTNASLVRGGFTGVTWNAIIEWPVEDVFAEIAEAGLALHEAYTKYKSSRVSCAFCIMSSGADMLAAAGCEDNHDIYRSMVELEATSTYAFQGARWLADVAPSLLSPELAHRVIEAKANGLVRQQAEAELPKHLLFTKGWPTSVPTMEEAELIASVRRRVSAALNLPARFLTGGEVRERYGELMSQSGASVMGSRAGEELEAA